MSAELSLAGAGSGSRVSELGQRTQQGDRTDVSYGGAVGDDLDEQLHLAQRPATARDAGEGGVEHGERLDDQVVASGEVRLLVGQQRLPAGVVESVPGAGGDHDAAARQPGHAVRRGGVVGEHPHRTATHAGPAPAAMARRPVSGLLRRSPVAALVLWQAVAVAAVLAALGAGLSLAGDRALGLTGPSERSLLWITHGTVGLDLVDHVVDLGRTGVEPRVEPGVGRGLGQGVGRGERLTLG